MLTGGRVVQRGTHDELIADSDGRVRPAGVAPGVARPAIGPVLARRDARRRRSRSCRFGASRRDARDRELRRSDRAGRPLRRSGNRIRLGSSSRSCCPTAGRSRRPPICRCRSMIPRPSGGSPREGSTSSSPSSSRARPPGRRRHLCRVEEGGSIFAISGVRGPIGRRPGGRRGRAGAAAEVRPGRPDPAELRGRALRAGRRADRRLAAPGRPRAGPVAPASQPRQELAAGRRSPSSSAAPASASARASPGSPPQRELEVPRPGSAAVDASSRPAFP